MQYSLPMACLKAETELAIRWSAAGDYAAFSAPKIGGENLSARHFADTDSGGFDRRTRKKKNQNGAQWQKRFITKHDNGTTSPPPPDKTGKTKIRCICESFRGEN